MPLFKRTKRKRSAVDLIRGLHHFIFVSMKPALNAALEAIVSKTTESVQLRFHLMLASYIVDTHEAEDLLSVKRSTRTVSPCHKCLAKRQQIPFCTKSTARKLQYTTEMFSALHRGDE